jgi:hypothetical protein
MPRPWFPSCPCAHARTPADRAKPAAPNLAVTASRPWNTRTPHPRVDTRPLTVSIADIVLQPRMLGPAHARPSLRASRKALFWPCLHHAVLPSHRPASPTLCHASLCASSSCRTSLGPKGPQLGLNGTTSTSQSPHHGSAVHGDQAPMPRCRGQAPSDILLNALGTHTGTPTSVGTPHT